MSRLLLDLDESEAGKCSPGLSLSPRRNRTELRKDEHWLRIYLFEQIESRQGTGKQMFENGTANKRVNQGAALLEEVHPGFNLALATPAGTSGRIVRGFARIGAAFQVLVCIVGLAIAALAEWHQYNDTNYDYERYACLLDHTGGPSLTADTFKAAAKAHLECGYFSDYDNYSILEWGDVPGGGTTRNRIWVNGAYVNYIPDQQLMWQTAKYVLGVLVATWIIGMIVYWLWVGLGWVLAGFFRD